MDKDVSIQVARAKARQDAVVSRSDTPEVEEHCLGRGALRLSERAEQLRQHLAQTNTLTLAPAQPAPEPSR